MSRRARVRIALAGLALLAAWRGAPGRTDHDTTIDRLRAGTTIAGPTRAAQVVALTDGDTLRVTVDGREETVRLIGIDTPETKKPSTPVECFGHDAADRLAQLAPVGTQVTLEADAEPRDRYGRLLAYVHRVDGLFVNLAMVAGGFAGTLSIPPNTAHAAELAAAADGARLEGRGLWSACGGAHELPR